MPFDSFSSDFFDPKAPRSGRPDSGRPELARANRAPSGEVRPSQSAPWRTACRLLWRYRRRWLIPAVVVTVLSGWYAALFPAPWRASVVVQPCYFAPPAEWARGRKAGVAGSPESFATEFQTLACQDTVLEEVLIAVGPRGISGSGAWNSGRPDREAVEDFGRRIAVTAVRPELLWQAADHAAADRPEVYLRVSVDAYDPDRAVRWLEQLLQQVGQRLEAQRRSDAESQARSAGGSAQAAELALRQAEQQLRQLELEVGEPTELGIAGETALAIRRLERETERWEVALQQSERQGELRRQLLEHLERASGAPQQVLAIPGHLTDLHPPLGQLQARLAASGRQLSQLMAEMSPRHPRVRAARQAHLDLQQTVPGELSLVTAAVRRELEQDTARAAAARDERADKQQELRRLGLLQARYADHLERVRLVTETWREAQHVELQAQEAARQVAATPALRRLNPALDPLATHMRAPTATGEPSTEISSAVPAADGNLSESADGIRLRRLGLSGVAIVAIGAIGGVLLGFAVLVVSLPPSEIRAGQPWQSGEESVSKAARGLSFKQTFVRFVPYRPSRN